MTDFSKAKAQAKAEHKMILMDFNGSDWCTGCQALRKNILSTSEFIEYAKKNLVLVDVDFPEHKAQAKSLKKANKALEKKFDVDGFPTLVILDSNGKQLKKVDGYEGKDPKEFIAMLENLQRGT